MQIALASLFLIVSILTYVVAVVYRRTIQPKLIDLHNAIGNEACRIDRVWNRLHRDDEILRELRKAVRQIDETDETVHAVADRSLKDHVAVLATLKNINAELDGLRDFVGTEFKQNNDVTDKQLQGLRNEIQQIGTAVGLTLGYHHVTGYQTKYGWHDADAVKRANAGSA